MLRVTTADGGELVVMNDRYLKELKSLPDTMLSAEIAVNENMVAKYSHIMTLNAIGLNTIRADLTPGLPRLMPSIASEARYSVRKYFPLDAEDWVEINAFQAILNSVAQVSARLFVGEDLCRDEEWLKVAAETAMAAFNTTYAMKKWSKWLHPFVFRFVPEYQTLQKVRTKGEAILKRHAAASHKEKKGEEEEDYLMTWISKKRPGFATDFAAQADLQLQFTVAAIHTTTMAMAHMLYDLAAHPEYTPILREEIKASLEATGGEYNRDCIAKMAKVDSFMKESQRLHPPSLTTFMRAVIKDITLSDGTTIPKGVMIAVDASARYRDPQTWENPNQFDGLRFLRLREQTQEKSNYQFVTSNTDNVAWGQGKHACPGIFFAGNEIKTIFAMFLLEYDISFPKGIQRPADNFEGSFVSTLHTWLHI
ncbi:cytochrome P450 [Corynespora cassiicola Philippines]|uniref:Cytochrome P450 n=1 Tax=Corynespora cassiicola Philippines TaxID=1448308 RepID=A0A2T2N953_CORCC|nr:cytochrome P450 [Corynespora cassiicola Philippines]